jgi:hypothetical protein
MSLPSVFAHRYRDVDAIIRSDCIRELGYWVKTYHETFLEPHYLRYCGWMLSDKVARTRLPSLIFLKDVLEDPKAGTVYVAGLRPFLERFRPRLIDMSKRDVDKRNREEAAQVSLGRSPLSTNPFDSLFPCRSVCRLSFRRRFLASSAKRKRPKMLFCP